MVTRAVVDPTYVALAHALADAAAEVTSKHFRTGILADTKSDDSPVTVADKEAELVMRNLISTTFPHHAMFGEEHGYTPPDIQSRRSTENNRYLWVMDPIDGTKSFITGKPLFGTLIALLKNGLPVLGILDQPILKERWVGIEGKPTTLNGQPINTRPCPNLSDAYLYATTPHMFSGTNEEAFIRLREAVRLPLYGCDCYAYGLLAAGHCDLVAEADLKPYDYMALVPIIQGAGGVCTDWRGQTLTWDIQEADQVPSFTGEVLAAGDEATHRQALKVLSYN